MGLSERGQRSDCPGAGRVGRLAGCNTPGPHPTPLPTVAPGPSSQSAARRPASRASLPSSHPERARVGQLRPLERRACGRHEGRRPGRMPDGPRAGKGRRAAGGPASPGVTSTATATLGPVRELPLRPQPLCDEPHGARRISTALPTLGQLTNRSGSPSRSTSPQARPGPAARLPFPARGAVGHPTRPASFVASTMRGVPRAAGWGRRGRRLSDGDDEGSRVRLGVGAADWLEGPGATVGRGVGCGPVVLHPANAADTASARAILRCPVRKTHWSRRPRRQRLCQVTTCACAFTWGVVVQREGGPGMRPRRPGSRGQRPVPPTRAAAPTRHQAPARPCLLPGERRRRRRAPPARGHLP